MSMVGYTGDDTIQTSQTVFHIFIRTKIFIIKIKNYRFTDCSKEDMIESEF